MEPDRSLGVPCTHSQPNPVYTPLQRMKRLFQPVAVLLVGLVAAQPALAGVLCAAPAAPCPMAITDMGASCGLASHANAGASPPATKPRPPPPPDTPFDALPEPCPSLLAIGQAPGETSSPPIYIRNR